MKGNANFTKRDNNSKFNNNSNNNIKIIRAIKFAILALFFNKFYKPNSIFKNY